MPKDQYVSKFPPFKLSGALTIGASHSIVAEFARYLDAIANEADTADIYFELSHTNLALLCHIGLLIRNSKTKQIKFHFQPPDKLPFYWQLAFFQFTRIHHERSKLLSVPDIWKYQPREDHHRLNFTPLLALEINAERAKYKNTRYSAIASDACERFLISLKTTTVWQSFKTSDLIDSGEFLSIVVWELLQNALDHSGGTEVVVAGELHTPTPNIAASADYALRLQHQLESQNSTSKTKRDWHKKHGEIEYLLLACVDDGIGIVSSLRARNTSDTRNDSKILEDAFSRNASLYGSADHEYDVHGLHAIAELIRLYGGYIFVQSNRAIVEYDGVDWTAQEVPASSVLKGTILEVLLPIECPQDRISRFPTPKAHLLSSRPLPNCLFALQELRRISPTLPPPPDMWRQSIENLVAKSMKYPNALYLDLSGLPRERHFLAKILTSIRKSRITTGPTVAINADPDTFAAISAITSLADSDAIRKADTSLRTAIVRESLDYFQPLLLPVIRFAPDGRTTFVQWLGLENTDSPTSRDLHRVLTHLFENEGSHDIRSIITRLEKQGEKIALNPSQLTVLLRSIQRANSGLLKYTQATNEWELTISASSVADDAIHSIRVQLYDALEADSVQHKTTDEGVVYYLKWRSADSNHIRKFYSAWNVVQNPYFATLAAAGLLRLANYHDPDLSPNARALISVTPSAGLIARELSRILRIPHYEAMSIDSLDVADWPVSFENESIILVDDIIDTGIATSLTIREIEENRKGNVTAILSLCATSEGTDSRKRNVSHPIIHLLEISLIRASEAETNAARKNKRLFAIDPFSLEPIRPQLTPDDWRRRKSEMGTEIASLCNAKALKFGHFTYSGHHYNIVFDIVALTHDQSLLSDLTKWFWRSVDQWVVDLKKIGISIPNRISVIYPYYSPICAFLHELAHAADESGPIVDSKPLTFSFHVAKPNRRSLDRTDYSLAYLKDSSELSSLCVFIDDSIVSGNTFATMVTEVLRCLENGQHSTFANHRKPTELKHILALTVFDRVGSHARSHVPRISSFQSTVSFRFLSRYALNLPYHRKGDCRTCRVLSMALKNLETLPKTLEPLAVQLQERLNHFRSVPINTIDNISFFSKQEQSFEDSSYQDIGPLSSLIFACDAIFSDLPSSREIHRSLIDSTKTAATRLELISLVLSDEYLYRTYHHRDQLPGEAANLILDPSVPCDYRMWFLLHLLSIPDPDFASILVWHALPARLLQNSHMVVIENITSGPIEEEAATFQAYLDENPSLLAALLVLLRQTLDAQSSTSKAENMERWRRVFENSPLQFYFAAAVDTLDNDHPWADARMLLSNFVLTFSRRHNDSFYNQLHRLLCMDSIEYSEATFERHNMDYICGAISNVKAHYRLPNSLFPEEDIKGLNGAFAAYLDGPSAGSIASFQEILGRTLVHSLPLQQHETSIEQLLRYLTPTLLDVLQELDKKGEEDVSRRFSWVSSACVDGSTMVFGTVDMIRIVILHLIKNFDSHGVEGLNVSLGIIPASAGPGEFREGSKREGFYVRFSVSGAGTYTSAEVESWFLEGGGLMAHRTEVERFRGSLYGVGGQNGRYSLILELPVIGVVYGDQNPLN